MSSQESDPQPDLSGFDEAREPGGEREGEDASPGHRWREIAEQHRGPAEGAGADAGPEGGTEAGSRGGSRPDSRTGPGDGERLTPWSDPVEADLDRLRQEARRAGREDGEAGVPAADAESAVEPESERSLRERCRALYERWKNRELDRYQDGLAEAEEVVSERLNQVSLGIDKLERMTSELGRLKARVAMKRDEVSEELEAKRGTGQTGFTTRWYIAVLVFLGSVEFFANAPVFNSLLPRDPLTERQIQLISETSQGWFAGVQRVFAHIALRPDAALLAAGVVTFLCVLAHFFGHSLRDLVIKRDRQVRQEAVAGRSAMENVVPMVLTGVGLVLVLGVLYEARVTLGEVGERQFEQDMAQVEELRREAGFLRSDGDLLSANERSNRADDLESAATNLRDYALSMSRMSFPILLLNLTLVLCAMTAAYFHRTDTGTERFTERPFEEQRQQLIDRAEETADRISQQLAEAVRGIRKLRGKVNERPLSQGRSLAYQLESVLSLYRSENARVRGLDPSRIPAFRSKVELDVPTGGEEAELAGSVRDPSEYEEERSRLAQRFEEARGRFNEEVTSQGALASTA